jgi:transcription-repair coupling factor (superfamily II helicase)
VDRFGELPDDVDHLSEMMLLKVGMRDLRLRALESGPGRLVVTLGGDALLEPSKVALLVQRSKGVYRLTPEMKLVVRRDGPDKPELLIGEAKKVLRDLGACALPDAAHV